MFGVNNLEVACLPWMIGLSATRPSVRVLRGLNITVYPGSYVAIVGASGSGYVISCGPPVRMPDDLGVTLMLRHSIARVQCKLCFKRVLP